MVKQLVIAAALASAGAAALAPAGAAGQTAARDMTVASATMIDRSGNRLGAIALIETPNGVLIQPNLENLPPGRHAFHIHQTGRCDPPDFQSAGGHYNPTGAAHGFLSPHGAHLGDLPNVHVGPDGRLQGDLLARNVTLEDGEATLFPDGGTAVVIHAQQDDYETDPAGSAGDRIACGVVERGE